MASNEPIDYDTLVREDRVHSSVYNDPQIFEDEVERVWRSRQDILPLAFCIPCARRATVSISLSKKCSCSTTMIRSIT
jgi:hypothetical protein